MKIEIADRSLLDERRLVDLGDLDDLAVGGRDDETLTSLAGALRIAEEISDPDRDDDEQRPRRARVATSAG